MGRMGRMGWARHPYFKTLHLRPFITTFITFSFSSSKTSTVRRHKTLTWARRPSSSSSGWLVAVVGCLVSHQWNVTDWKKGQSHCWYGRSVGLSIINSISYQQDMATYLCLKWIYFVDGGWGVGIGLGYGYGTVEMFMVYRKSWTRPRCSWWRWI